MKGISHEVAAPRWALWNYETKDWDEVPSDNAPGEWRGGHDYGNITRRSALTDNLITLVRRLLETNREEQSLLFDDRLNDVDVALGDLDRAKP